MRCVEGSKRTTCRASLARREVEVRKRHWKGRVQETICEERASLRQTNGANLEAIVEDEEVSKLEACSFAELLSDDVVEGITTLMIG